MFAYRSFFLFRNIQLESTIGNKLHFYVASIKIYFSTFILLALKCAFNNRNTQIYLQCRESHSFIFPIYYEKNCQFQVNIICLTNDFLQIVPRTIKYQLESQNAFVYADISNPFVVTK
ncbi:hypothetical protein T4D_6067 [Trichinella pseudospiralis]|uniref:Uncharacterized protein n=1 Tax=Trichinella pseudospiralis TaxID=6337 RepID=A0A0V1F766_TRIPS|nr:hypothetical protein T4D_6067 [Trichinella pseudospiralis]